MNDVMLASYGEGVGAAVAVGLAVGIFYRWFWSGELAPDPWEQNDDSEDTEDEESLYQRCRRPDPHRADVL